MGGHRCGLGDDFAAPDASDTVSTVPHPHSEQGVYCLSGATPRANIVARCHVPPKRQVVAERTGICPVQERGWLRFRHACLETFVARATPVKATGLLPASSWSTTDRTRVRLVREPFAAYGVRLLASCFGPLPGDRRFFIPSRRVYAVRLRRRWRQLGSNRGDGWGGGSLWSRSLIFIMLSSSHSMRRKRMSASDMAASKR